MQIPDTQVALRLLRLGHGCGRASGTDGAVHRLAVGVAAAMVMLTGWLFVAAAAAYHQRDARMASRAPMFTTGPDAPDAAAWWIESTDTAHSRHFTVVTIVPLRQNALPPPGLTRWPAPGEAFVSRAVAAHDARGDLHRRYGRVAGIIDRWGLSEPTEWLVYRRPNTSAPDDPSTTSAPNSSRRVIRGFGSTRPGLFGLDLLRRPCSETLRALVVLTLPALVLIVIAASTGSRPRDSRLAMLDALGAPTRARSCVLLGEALFPSAAGVALGTVIALLTTLIDVRLPFSKYVVQASDLATARRALLFVALGSLLVMPVAVVAAHLRQRTWKGQRPRAVMETVRRWSLGVLVTAVLLTITGTWLSGLFGRIIYGVGMLATLATLPMVATTATTRLGQRIVASGSARGLPARIVGGRWLVARPSSIATAGAMLVIGLGLAAQVTVLQTQLTGIEPVKDPATESVGDTMGEFLPSALAPDELERYVTTLDPQRVLRIYQDGLPMVASQSHWTHPVRTVVVGSPAALGMLGTLAAVPDTPTPAIAAFDQLGVGWSRLATLRVLNVGLPSTPDANRYPDRLLVSTTVPSATQGPPLPPWAPTLRTVVVLKPDGRAEVDRLIRAADPRQFEISATVTNDDVPAARHGIAWAVANDDVSAARRRTAWSVTWLFDGGLIAMITLLLAGALGAAGVFVAQSHEVGPQSGLQIRRQCYQAIAFWSITVPLILVSTTGTALAIVLARLLTSLAQLGRVPLPFIGGWLLTSVGVAIAVGIICGEVALRAARAMA